VSTKPGAGQSNDLDSSLSFADAIPKRTPMRQLIILAIFAFGVLWAFDAYEYDGRYSRNIWQQGVAEGQYFSYQVQLWINKILSGRS